jgi:hypothetical protein
MESLEEPGHLLTISDDIDARLAGLELWRWSIRYRENLASHLMLRFRSPVPLIAGEVDALADAARVGRISRAEWDQVIALDVLASATDISLPEHPEVYVAIELSMVIDDSDVERARERADILARALDLPVVPCVDGEAILRDAEMRAAQLGVVNLRG